MISLLMQIHILNGNKGIFSTSKKSQIDGYCTDCKVKQKFFKRMLKFIHFNGMLVGEQLPNSALHQGHLKRPRLTNHHNVSMGCFLKKEYCLALPNFFWNSQKCFGPDLIKSVWFFIEILVHAVLCYMPNCSSTFKRFLISGWELNVTGDVRISTNRCSSAILLIPF